MKRAVKPIIGPYGMDYSCCYRPNDLSSWIPMCEQHEPRPWDDVSRFVNLEEDDAAEDL